MLLTGAEIRARRIVVASDDADLPPEHVQQNGVDLSLHAVWRLAEAGALGRSNDDRYLPGRETLPIGEDDWLFLPLGSYGVQFAERVRLPLDCGALAFPRSSLLRMGAHMPTAVWDAGYEGRGESLIVVGNPHGLRLQQGARVAQLIVLRLTEAALEGYAGRYQERRP